MRGALRAVAAVLVSAAAAAAPCTARALEERFDHRDQQGLVLEQLLAHDTVAITGRAAHSTWRPALRLAWSWDMLGEGDELLVGAQGALSSWSDPDREKVRLALDARYRSYFGTEEWKTFFEVGVWAPVASRLAAGPLVAIGAAYDFSRAGGLYAEGGFATSFGQARIASLSMSVGAQVRF